LRQSKRWLRLDPKLFMRQRPSLFQWRLRYFIPKVKHVALFPKQRVPIKQLFLWQLLQRRPLRLGR
jgi:hypothetical protein